MEINQKENELHVYSINENEHIGAINADFVTNYGNRPVVILDCSSAAGDVSARLVKEVFPLLSSKVKNWDSTMQLITFGEECVSEQLNVTDLSKFDLKSAGAANVGPAIEKLRFYFENFSSSYFYSFNVMTISAGEISDRENAEQETKKLTEVLATKTGWRINSQAVRLFTASNNHQPDTRALSYLLQINNTTHANICDINVTSSNEAIANQIGALFPENETKKAYLEIKQKIFSRFPWESTQWEEFILSSGLNIFWLGQLPTKNVIMHLSSTSNKDVNVIMESQLNLEKFQQLMAKKLPQIASHMKILKIIGTTEANETVDRIFSYFAKTEEALAVKSSTPNNKIVTNTLAVIATYEANFRDSTEMVEFYRKTVESLREEECRKIEEAAKETERLRLEEEERVKREEREEEERRQQKEEERQKQEEEDRVRREEEARKTDPNSNPNSVQTVFILDEHSSDANENRRLTDKIVPLMLSKMFHESLQLVHLVTFLRHTTTTAETLQTLIKTLDATKRIRISVLTNGDVHKWQKSENFAEKITEFLNGSGYSFEVQVVRLASPALGTKRYKLVEVNASESNEFIAEQIVSLSLQ